MSEIEVDVLIVETDQQFTTPFTVELDTGNYTIRGMYEDKTQEKTAVIVAGEKTIVNFYFEVLSPRKGLPSSSVSVEVIINPKPVNEYEDTSLTLKLDKTSYTSEEVISMNGKLVFVSDQAPLTGRTIKVYENDVETGTITTDENGDYVVTRQAPVVQESCKFNYKTTFGGD